MKILVADDSKTNLAIITSTLQRLGHVVIPVMSGEEAIEAYKKEMPDLIMLDVVMEGMNGYECAEKIRTINQDRDDWIPIIFLSASLDDISVARGIDAGGDDYITKPFSEVTLEAKIKAMQRISEMRRKLYDTTQELKILSSTDTLTGVYNRFQFEKSIKEKLATADRHNLKLAVIFLDLDNFKSINDNLGHHIGDMLIKGVADRLQTCLRADDFIARIGGDEFVLILMDNDNSIVETAETVSRKILEKLEEPFNLSGNIVKISCSIGIACYPYEDVTAETVIQSADIAMYHAKELGRNNYQFYTAALNRKYRKQLSLENELKFALHRNQLYITYQPIYHLVSRQIIGTEAVLRWKHNDFGIISPDIFIPIAEQNGLIIQMGAWALQQVCEQGAIWSKMHLHNFKLYFNLSLHQFLQDQFFQILKATLNDTHIPPGMLEFELAETSFMTFTDHLRHKIHELNTNGISIAINNFGSRHSSLSSLLSLPISTIKIDKEFLENIKLDVKNSIIVKALITLGNNLKMNVIAEGIEKEEQLQFLIINGCTQGQGMLLSKPQTAKRMTEMLKQENRGTITQN